LEGCLSNIIIIGFLYAGGVHVEDFKACVKETQVVINDFIGAVKYLKKNNGRSVKKALKLLGEGL
jgi:hypothetical protein